MFPSLNGISQEPFRGCSTTRWRLKREKNAMIYQHCVMQKSEITDRKYDFTTYSVGYFKHNFRNILVWSPFMF